MGVFNVTSGASTSFSLDIQTILTQDLDAWSKRFYWPTPHALFRNLTSELLSSYWSYVNRYPQGSLANEVLLISHKVILEYAILLYSFSVLKSLEQSGKSRPATSPESHWHFLIHEGRPRNVTADIIFNHRFDMSVKARWMRRLRNTARRFKASSTQTWRSLIYPSRANHLVFQPNPLCKAFIRSRPADPWMFAETADLFGWASAPLSLDTASLISTLGSDLLRMAKSLEKKHAIQLPEASWKFLTQMTKDQMTASAQDYTKIRLWLRQHHVSKLFTGCVGGYYRRVAAAAMKAEQGEVISFDHGGHTWHPYEFAAINDFYVLNNFYAVDRYILYSKSVIPLARKLLERSSISRLNSAIVFEATPSAEYQTLAASKGSVRSDLPLKRIMLIGSIFLGERILMNYESDPIHLDLEYRLIQCLTQAGFEVIYKQHPGGILRAPVEWNNPLVKSTREPFENVLNQADAFIFTYTATSALAPALCTKKPVFILDCDRRDWQDDRKTLEDRCTFIPCEVDSRQRVLFDEARLLDAIRNKREPENSQFAANYLLS
jgi:hypothetical protein